METTLNLLAFASACSLITIAFGYFSEKRKKADLIIVFSLCFVWGVNTLFILADELALYKAHPHLLYLYQPFELFLGPLVYYRFRILIEGKMKFDRLAAFLFMPGVLAIVYFIPFYALGADEKLAYIGFHAVRNDLARGIYLAILYGQTPWFLFCVVLFIAHGSRMLSARGIRLMMQKKVLVAYNLVWIVIAVTGYSMMLMGQSLLVRVMIIVTNGMLILFYYLEKKYEGFFLRMREDSSETRYRRSIVKGINTGAVIERIHELMELEHVYLDDELTLRGLGSRLGVTPHQLSEILNDRLRTNFRTFINTHRVNAAKRLLLEDGNISVIRAAYQCGFNSKNAFNTAFHKQEGITPTEFRERHKKMRHDL